MYIPQLLERFVRQSIFYKMIDYQIDLGAQRTGKVVFTQRLTAPPNIAALDNRVLWLPQLYTDSRELEITCTRYGDKIQIHKYDDRITYWQEAGAVGLKSIMQNDLAPHLTQSLDKLARNAFLSSHFCTFGGDATGFDNLAKADVFEVDQVRAVKLRADYASGSIDMQTNPLFCITSPSAVYTVRHAQTGEWLTRNQYANPSILVNGEIGSYEDCRFVTSPEMTLWNCGEIIQQTHIDATIAIGDGAPDPASKKVDGVWAVGQAGSTHYITVDSTTGFTAGDFVTLHRVKNQAQTSKRVLNGVQWDHEYNLDLRIAEIIDRTTMSFNTPIMVDWFVDAITSGLYGYVTKARPVHCALYILGPRAVVAGVAQSPGTYVHEPMDDAKSIYRFAWDAYLKFQPMFTERFIVHFFAGPVDVNGVVTEL